MKKLLCCVLAALLLAGCGGGSAAAKLPEDPTALDIMRLHNTALPTEPDDNWRSFYEIFVYSFYDSDGDGIGDLNGVREKLDYINDGDPATDTDLSATGIWLMPVNPSTTYHKYDVTDYTAIDPEYGTMEDFDALLAECHARGIHVILDLVLNHTSSQHPWFKAAAEYLQGLAPGAEPDPAACPYVQYYHFSREPGGSRYRLGESEWYYEAPFWSEMPDLDLENEAVRAEIDDIVQFWFDKGVDGFRLDAAKEYVSGNVQANVEILRWFNDLCKSKKPDAYLVAEVWDTMQTYTPYYASGIDSVFNFAFADQGGVIANTLKKAYDADAGNYVNNILAFQDAVAPYGDTVIDAPFYTNHDLGRSAGYYAGDYAVNQIKMAQAMNLLMSGSSFVYYGEELGMKGAGKDENKRAPMYWSDDAAAPGMCNGPADMEPPKMLYGSYETQKDDGDSIFNFVVQAMRLRGAFNVIRHGTVDDSVVAGDTCVLHKTYDGQELLLAFNLGEAAQDVPLPTDTDPAAWDLAGVLVTTPEDVLWADGALTLPPYSAAVLAPAA